jgi:hypothetical protein
VIRRVDVGAGEHRDNAVGQGAVPQCQRDSRTRPACGATAHGIHNNHHRARLIDGRIDGFGRSGFLNSDLRQFVTHRLD